MACLCIIYELTGENDGLMTKNSISINNKNGKNPQIILNNFLIF